MTSEILVREAIASEVPAIARIDRESFPDHTRALLGQKTCEEYITSVFDHDAFSLLVACADDEVLGYAVLHTDPMGSVGKQWILRSWPAIIMLVVRRPIYVLRRLSSVLYEAIRLSFAMRTQHAPQFSDGSSWQETAYLDVIAVKKSARGKKLGARLLDSCISVSRKKKLSKLKLTVKANNASAVALYRSMGFTTTGENVQSHVFTKDLAEETDH